MRARRWMAGLIVGLMVSSGTIEAQPDPFPRTVIDLTGQAVTIPARPAVIGVAGVDAVLAQLIAAENVRIIEPLGDPARAVWDEIDLLVIADLYAAANPALVVAAEQAQVPVFRTIAITSLAGWRKAVQQVGAATGRDAQANNLMLQLEWRLAWSRHRAADCPAPRVLVLTPEGYTFGAGALITDLIAAAGGINVAADAGYADYRQLTGAALRDLVPDVILLAPAWERDAFLHNPAYADLPAVQAGRVMRLPFSPTNPPDPGRAVVLLTWALHPLRVRDLFGTCGIFRLDVILFSPL